MEWVVAWIVAILLSGLERVEAQGNNGGLSGLAIGLIVAGAVVFVIIVIVAGLCCFNYKRKHLGHLEFEHPEFERSREPYIRTSSFSHNPDLAPVRYDATVADIATDIPTGAESDGDTASADNVVISPSKAEKRERFEKQLRELQPHAVTFLEMQKDVQERIKNAKHGNPRVHGYKAVARDLSRVQHLLSNRNSAGLKMPPDGLELLAWAGKTHEKYLELQRYKSKRDSGLSSEPPEVWIQSKDDSVFEDESHNESDVI
ncbi:uncharacterized protein LOC110980231 [Acanthaster planci]|uniref:Uncharacterized protein LOC110980231 n=1 Tax=Acanthaster planci TaxID=133434 RepID=A0A8B7YJ21_ACAPL|nr:uncharacterized protein LOC110980231 [Acanthaster planci]XP_022092399.1 uncharacterized protein LOC110980231 [Acanthaster planci]XP_022092400.1 uncharacterized protein LOC110980231 [Acanthaster planci]XP_022092401.1 uncharacterized protein LOC110980231 [Acanthaster planci]